MRGSRSRAIRGVAWGVVAAGVLAPLVRKRVSTPPIVAQTVAFAAPVGLCVAVPRSRTRDVAVCCLQMWAYLAAYKAPHDDEHAQVRRVQVDYPIAIDRALGLGELPTVRLQRRLARRQWRVGDRVLVWAHWLWFLVPHGTLVYIMLRHRSRFDRSAVMTYAVFDIGAMIYWVLPTAPPWYAAAHGGRSRDFNGRLLGATSNGSSHDFEGASPSKKVFQNEGTSGFIPGHGAGSPRDVSHVPPARASTSRDDQLGPGTPQTHPHPEKPSNFDPAVAALTSADEGSHDIAVRRMMVEYGEFFWKDGWGPLYSVLGGNPLAAMPSLHFATSMMAAQLLAETGPLAGALGWGYTATLGFALVYLGEHYVVDLLAGAALTTFVRRVGPSAAPALAGFGKAVAALEAVAQR